MVSRSYCLFLLYILPESVTSWLQHLPDAEYYILSRQRYFFQSIKTQFSSWRHVIRNKLSWLTVCYWVNNNPGAPGYHKDSISSHSQSSPNTNSDLQKMLASSDHTAY
jgi:hypothetical protein